MAISAMRPSMGALGRISSAYNSSSSSLPTTTAILRPLTQTATLSTTASLLKRHKYPGARDNKDHSKHRGESAVRRTGTRWRLSMSDEPLPRPVPRDQLPAIETDPDHGLWDFFPNRTTVANTPEEDAKHGRSWSVEELRHKSWDDLHRLWWVCVKERNRIATANWERNKSKLGFGEAEALGRDREVRATMRAIKHTLTERFYTWEDAVKLAENDPEVDLTGNGPAFVPRDYLEEGETAAVEGEQQIAETAQNAEAAPAAALDPVTISSSKPQAEAPRL
ncbi:MRP-L47-domain-containing protein [Parathielavia appendiculata]|uniref:Large ribosomal subunit protein uL29m n=1 Tax=Parathielavia appendiculata TaxID=2587402 RepID=A0AAN6U4L5_9PEZI|nr:MRP-L47-domain-containing protein [Parathielavia appendiculata]